MILSGDFNKNMYCLLQYIKRGLVGNKVCVCLYTTLLTPSLNPLTCCQDLFLSLTVTDSMGQPKKKNVYTYIYVCITESLGCTAEINTVLYINYTPITKKN